MKRIVIIHFQPIELYPPIQNLLTELNRRNLAASVFTTAASPRLYKPFQISDHVKLIRIGKSYQSFKAAVRYLNYLRFFSASLIHLAYNRPDRILYFETISSWPAYIYKRFFKSNCEILIHYHEYTSVEEYKNGMNLSRYFHQMEKWIYPRASWVSHTNHFRMEMFKRDIEPIQVRNAQIIPNYPPTNWRTDPKQFKDVPLRIVYVGSLSLATMYTKEFANWIVSKRGEITWDIYSYNFTSDVEAFLRKLNAPWIKLMPGVEYNQLPSILKQYDIGVILYTGHLPNFIYNAPNKFFEYLACGLDVWFPNVMIGSLEFVREDISPKVLTFDFTNLKEMNLAKAMEKIDLTRENSFFCENSLTPLINKLMNP